MSAPAPIKLDAALARLERQLRMLLTRCQDLEAENRALKAECQELRQRYANLEEKNEMVRDRVEGMVSRLKRLEQDG